jgi:hypothetical protein
MASRFFLFALAATSVLAAPHAAVHKRQACTNPKQRKAWHKMTNEEKKAYLDAEVCLMNTPAEQEMRGAETVFDELQSIHVNIAQIAHFVGAFLPFHRYFMWAHEHKLETICGYTGGQPYWEESLDAGNFSKSEIFDAEFGFGGDGVGTERCVTDGPFAGYMNNLGPGYEINKHCINRRISDFASQPAVQSNVDTCLRATSYTQAWNCIEGQPHGAGHGGVGEQMMNPISSPGDPLFYMHHTWLDKIWWDWQARDLETRLTAIGGNNEMNPAFANGLFGNRPDDLPVPEVKGDPGSTTTLTHIIEMYGVVPDVTIADVMDPSGMLCFEYIDFRD